MHTLADRIRRTLKPGVTHRGLFSRKHIYKGLAEKAKMICVFDVTVQGCRIELGQYIHSFDLGIDTI
jgi:hypothetical protein